jgi:hypothetical protein
MAGCALDPTAFTRWKTAYVDGATFTAYTVTATFTGPTHFTYIFPDLILTMLTPGELMIQVPCPLVKLGLMIA